jgi:hypothetical protein
MMRLDGHSAQRVARGASNNEPVGARIAYRDSPDFSCLGAVSKSTANKKRPIPTQITTGLMVVSFGFNSLTDTGSANFG